MSVSIPDFWKLAVDSRLLSPADCQRLGQDFGSVKGAADAGNSRTLAEWLIAKNVMSRYQTTVLLSGRAGPFYYGEYRVYDRIDKGARTGMFKAVHAPTGYPVVLRFLGGNLAADPQALGAAMSRSQTYCATNHPNLVRGHELVDLGTHRFLVLEDPQGQSLEQLLASAGRMPPQEACRALRDASQGLAALHQMGFVHGDVRPATLWVAPNGNVKLLYDPLTPVGPLNLSAGDPTGQLTARADYLAPELLQPGHEPDVLSDVYSLGATLYQMLAGQPPFAGGDLASKLSRHTSQAIQPLEQIVPVPPQLTQLVAFMMAKNPAVRFQQALAVGEQAAAFINPADLTPRPPMSVPTLAAFEQFIQQKQALLVTQTPAFGATTVGGFPGAAPAAPRGMAVPNGGAPLPGAGYAPGVGMPHMGPAAVKPVTPVVSATAGMAPRGMAPVGLAPPGTTPVGAGVAVMGSPVGVASAVRPAVGSPIGAPVGSIVGGGGSTVTRRRTKTTAEKNKQLLIVSGAAVLGVALLGIIALNWGGGSDEDDQVASVHSGLPEEENAAPREPGSSGVSGSTVTSSPITSGPTTSANSGTSTPPSNPGSSTSPATSPGKPVVKVVDQDDSVSLWASPTNGDVISFANVPPNAQIFFIVRPAAMLSTSAGLDVMKVLGPDFMTARRNWEGASGIRLEEVEQMIISLHDYAPSPPHAAMVVRLKDPVSLAERWGTDVAAGSDPVSVRGWSMYVPEDGGGKLFVMGMPEEISAVVESKGRPPLLSPPDLERLLRSSDSQRHFNALVAPNYLAGDGGDALFTGNLSKLRAPLDAFFGQGLKAALLSAHFEGNFYVEARLHGVIEKSPSVLNQEFKTRIAGLSDQVRNYVVSLSAPEYWRNLWFNFPQMVGFAVNQVRYGEDEKQAVINLVLPDYAAANLVAATELSLASTPGVMVAGGPTVAKEPIPQTIEELLNKKFDLVFPLQNLEFAMRDLGQDVRDNNPGLPFEFEIKIIGTDLQLDGITRNQQIKDFEAKNLPIGEILTKLVMKANPITTVKDPSEADQKLIWVIGPDPMDPNKQMVLITTRGAAATKKYTLPKPFQPKS